MTNESKSAPDILEQSTTTKSSDSGVAGDDPTEEQVDYDYENSDLDEMLGEKKEQTKKEIPPMQNALSSFQYIPIVFSSDDEEE